MCSNACQFLHRDRDTARILFLVLMSAETLALVGIGAADGLPGQNRGDEEGHIGTAPFCTPSVGGAGGRWGGEALRDIP